MSIRENWLLGKRRFLLSKIYLLVKVKAWFNFYFLLASLLAFCPIFPMVQAAIALTLASLSSKQLMMGSMSSIASGFPTTPITLRVVSLIVESLLTSCFAKQFKTYWSIVGCWLLLGAKYLHKTNKDSSFLIKNYTWALISLPIYSSNCDFF